MIKVGLRAKPEDPWCRERIVHTNETSCRSNTRGKFTPASAPARPKYLPFPPALQKKAMKANKKSIFSMCRGGGHLCMHLWRAEVNT